jgi:spore coat polysaccharide biosynthesis predicted glycosyltransferase SpsG
MNWLIIIDTRKKSGLGHFFRSLCVAKALMQHSFVDILVTEDHQIIERYKKSYNFMSFSQVDTKKYQGVFVDCYELSDQYKCILERSCFKVTIKDSNAQRVSEFDLVLSLVSESDKFKYAIVRPAFFSADGISENSNTVLCNFGGYDKHKMTFKVIDALKDLFAEYGCKVQVIAGSSNTNINQVRQYLEDSSLDYNIAIDTPLIHEIMSQARLVIGAGGVGLLERIAMKMPSITIATAANQLTQTNLAIKLGATLDGGYAESFDSEDLCDSFSSLYTSSAQRARLIDNCRDILDDQGATRIASVMNQELQKNYAYI